MAKTIAINPSWYWPDDVPRLLGVPPMRCERLLVERWARRRPDQAALVQPGARSGPELLTYAQLAERVAAAAAGLRERADQAEHVALLGASGIEYVVAMLAAMAAGSRPLLLGGRQAQAAELAAKAGAALAIACDGVGGVSGLESVELKALEAAGAGADPAAVLAQQAAQDVHAPALDLVNSDGLLVAHSHYSLISGAVSLNAFLGVEGAQSWLSAMPLDSWEGLYTVLSPLFTGAAAVLSGEGGLGDHLAGAVFDHAVGYVIAPFESLSDLSRGRPKRLADAFKRNLGGLLLAVDRPFPANDRRKARKALDVPILTIFGQTECGPILAAHPSWYIDESVGIPMTNVEVQPANPQTGEPLDTNWELLDYATMVVRTPLVMSGYESGQAVDERHAERIDAGWFRTWTNASFDANGMMYLVEG